MCFKTWGNVSGISWSVPYTCDHSTEPLLKRRVKLFAQEPNVVVQ